MHAPSIHVLHNQAGLAVNDNDYITPRPPLPETEQRTRKQNLPLQRFCSGCLHKPLLSLTEGLSSYVGWKASTVHNQAGFAINDNT